MRYLYLYQKEFNYEARLPSRQQHCIDNSRTIAKGAPSSPSQGSMLPRILIHTPTLISIHRHNIMEIINIAAGWSLVKQLPYIGHNVESSPTIGTSIQQVIVAAKNRETKCRSCNAIEDPQAGAKWASSRLPNHSTYKSCAETKVQCPRAAIEMEIRLDWDSHPEHSSIWLAWTPTDYDWEIDLGCPADTNLTALLRHSIM